MDSTLESPESGSLSEAESVKDLRDIQAMPNLRRTTSHELRQQASPSRANEPMYAEDGGLPFRTLTDHADMEEYTQTNALGVILSREKTNDGKIVGYKLVAFHDNDPGNPKTWSKAYKWYCTMVVAFTCFVVALCSSVITADLIGVSQEFGVSDEIALLSVTLFVIGFGLGPMVFAPFSELFGRRIIYGTTLFVAVIFLIPCAVSDNITTLLVCRAIDGIAFSAPMTLVGGTLADLWRPEERGVPMAAFSAAPFLGPAIGRLHLLSHHWLAY